MSRETAAAILTRIYYDHTPGAKQELKNHKEGQADNVESIGRIYVAFLGKQQSFEDKATRKVH